MTKTIAQTSALALAQLTYQLTLFVEHRLLFDTLSDELRDQHLSLMHDDRHTYMTLIHLANSASRMTDEQLNDLIHIAEI